MPWGSPKGSWVAERAIVIRGGTVVDGSGSRVADVAVNDGLITAVEPTIEAGAGVLVLDASGCVVAPGLVDLHVHLREPGREQAETVETGSRAAALGGFTALVAMPNTEPAIDCAAVARQVIELGRRSALCDVHVAGAITVGREGRQLSPMAELAELGVHMFTDDGSGVQDSRLMRRALEYGRALGITLAQHCEDLDLAAGGHMHEGAWSSRLGIAGIPAEAEELMVMRDIALCRLTGAPIHFLHLSTAGSVAMVGAAKSQGLPVTSEAAPHHFTLTDASVQTFDTVFKVNPPLRTDGDVGAVRRGLASGAIDAIATDHAPHTQEVKEAPWDDAPPGMLGLETALPLALGELDLPIEQVLALMSWQPARIAGIADRHGGPITAGRPANIVVIDPAHRWVVEADRLASRSHNTPYAGRELTGRARHTICGGDAVVVGGEATR